MSEQILFTSLIAIAVLGGLAIGGLVTACILFYKSQRVEADEAYKAIQQAFTHIHSSSVSEAVNATSMLRYNDKLVEKMDEPQEQAAPTKPEPNPVLRDKVSGREYDILTGV